MKKIISVILALSFLTTCLTGCAGSVGDTESTKNSENNAEAEVTLNIAYQYGLAYAPVMIAQQKGLIEEAYQEATGKQVKVTWNQMSSGADINTGIAGGSIQIGFMGIAPAITGVTSNVGYKIFTNVSGQEHGFMTNDASIRTMQDLVNANAQIAVVNIGSFQHIILARALENAGLDSHALDANLVAMKHPDGKAAVESGSISSHVTSSPYIFQERENENLYEIPGVNQVCTVEDSFVVGVASETLYQQNKELYQAVCDGLGDAVAYVNENKEEAAGLICEYDGNDAATELKYMERGFYSTKTKGVYDLAVFMAKNGFIDKAPQNFGDLAYENVEGN